ncbi:MAG: class I SAM-dependent RNA methyltransferase [Cyclobacteriaceae bacterium]|nr:class I SAM-dependent RNA methyltransferase [Cyclobacteriaceae bacterium]
MTYNLKQEIDQMKRFEIIKEDDLGLELRGDMLDCMYLNMHCRCAYKVLFLIKEFQSSDAEHLYIRLNRAIKWDSFVDVAGYFSVSGKIKNESILDERFAFVRVKDAIADYFMHKFDRRPDSGPRKHGVNFFLFWEEQNVRIFLDTSGETLSKHGYRKIPGKAPMVEALAAACVMGSGFERDQVFINPMCGSGTLAIEAALMQANKAPGLMREDFSFMQVPGYDASSWEKIKQNAESKIIAAEPYVKILASDISEDAVEIAQVNAQAAGVEDRISFDVCDFKKSIVPQGKGVVFFNPEYGLRLGEEEKLEPVYQEIGDFFKKECQGKTGAVFTGNLNLAKKIGLRTKKRIPYFNAQIECRLLLFEIF